MNLGDFKDLGELRPWLDPADGKSYVTVIDPVSCLSLIRPSDRPATLTREEWIALDRAVGQGFRSGAPLCCWLLNQQLFCKVGLPRDGSMRTGVMRLSYETMTENCPPLLPLKSLHLPYISIKLLLSERKRRELTDASTYFAEAGAKVGSALDHLLLFGSETPPITGLSHATGTMGFFLIEESLPRLEAKGFPGPYVVFLSDQMRPSPHLITLPGVTAVLGTPHLGLDELYVIQATANVLRLVVGVEPIAVQWGDAGQYKVLCCIAPQISQNHNGNCGIARRR